MAVQDGVPKQPSEEEMRAAYEAELNRITSTDMILQTVVSLVSIGGRRLGLAAGTESQRDAEQVRDAIDGARALMGILERRMPRELGPLRDAIAQLQLAYAREVQGTRDTESAAGQPPPARSPSPAMGGDEGSARPAKQDEKGDVPPAGEKPRDAGPAESSGRLWVPGR